MYNKLSNGIKKYDSNEFLHLLHDHLNFLNLWTFGKALVKAY